MILPYAVRFLWLAFILSCFLCKCIKLHWALLNLYEIMSFIHHLFSKLVLVTYLFT